MKPLTRLAALLAALGGALPSSSAPTDALATTEQLRPENPPQLVSISFSGNGCPQGHAPKLDPASTDDDDTLGFRFDDSFRAVSPGSKRTVNCQAHLNANGTSAGWQMTLSDVFVRGKATLQGGAAMRYFTTVYFSQTPADTLTIEGQLKNNRGGGIKDVPVTIHANPRGNGVWGPCTTEGGSPGILNVNFRVSLPSDSENSFVVETEKWMFRWRRC